MASEDDFDIKSAPWPNDKPTLRAIAEMAWELSTYAAVVAMDEDVELTQGYRSELIERIERVQEACKPLVDHSGTMPVDDGHVRKLKLLGGGK